MATVVVGYVPKPEGRAALDVAIAEAGRRQLGVLVINSRRRSEDEAAGEDLAMARSRLEGSGIEFEVREVSAGLEAAEDIVETAGPDDLIVIGLRRRTPLGKLILGSSAQRILLDAPCPVLTVKPR